MIIQIALCDDNEKELTILKQFVQEVMEEQVIPYNIHEFSSGEKLLESNLIFHIIFLDIFTADINGIEVGKKIYKLNHSIKIIYQTSITHFWNEAVNQSHAFAYLLKPLQKKSIEKQILDYLENEKNNFNLTIHFSNVKYEMDGVETEIPLLKLPLEKIIYLEYIKMQRKVRIITSDKKYIYTESFGALERRMSPLGFEVCCRGILLNLSHITNLKRHSILLSNGDTVSLSQRRAVQFKKRMNEFLHNF